MDKKEKIKRDKELKMLLYELQENPYQRFNLAFALISIIPFLSFFYIITVQLYAPGLIVNDVTMILALTLLISISGYYIAYMVIKSVLDKLVIYSIRAKHSDSLKSTFVATVSHELKSPLAVIKTNIANLLGNFLGSVNEEQKKILAVCTQVVDRMDRLIHDVLDLYKIEAGMVEVKDEPCDINGLIDIQARELAVIFEKNRVKFNRDVKTGELVIRADIEKIATVINNLLTNALKYTPENGTITVKAYTQGEFIRMEFINTGQGIPEDKLEKIFDKFEKLDKTKEGVGLGLAITKDIVELHKGKIWAESDMGNESRFMVLLPKNTAGKDEVRHGAGKRKDDTHNR